MLGALPGIQNLATGPGNTYQDPRLTGYSQQPRPQEFSPAGIGALPGMPGQAPGALPAAQQPMGDPTNPYLPQPPSPESLYGLVGSNNKADLAMAMAMGGFGMAAAAGRPGATFLGALGEGGQLGLRAVSQARAAAAKSDAASAAAAAEIDAAKLLAGAKLKKENEDREIKKQEADAETRRAATDAAKIDDTTLIRNLIASGLKPGTTAFQKAMTEQLADSASSDAFIRALEASNIDPASDEGQKLIQQRLDKLTHISDSDPLVDFAKAMIKGTSEYEKAFGKGLGEAAVKTVERGVTAVKSLPTLGVLETTLAQLDYTGTGSTTIQEIKKVAQTIAAEFGFTLPSEMLSDPNFDFGASLQNKFVSAMLKSEMGARPSDKDLAFLASTLPNMGLTKEANQKIIDHFRERLLVDIEDSMELYSGRVLDDNASGSSKRALAKQRQSYETHMDAIMARVLSKVYKVSPRMKSMITRYIKEYKPL